MLDVLFHRRSIRKYKQEPIESEKVQDLMRAALLAPSSKGIYSQRFIFVDDKDLLQRLSESRESGSAYLKDAPLAIVVSGDSKATDVWTEDASIAAIIIQLTAQSLGLGSCWIQIRNRKHNENKTTQEYLQEILNIPQDIQVECIIAIGYPAEQKPQRTDRELQYDRVFNNTYEK